MITSAQRSVRITEVRGRLDSKGRGFYRLNHADLSNDKRDEDRDLPTQHASMGRKCGERLLWKGAAKNRPLPKYAPR